MTKFKAFLSVIFALYHHHQCSASSYRPNSGLRTFLRENNNEYNRAGDTHSLKDEDIVHEKAICYTVDGDWKIARHFDDDRRREDFTELMALAQSSARDPDGFGDTASYFAERRLNGDNPNLVRFHTSYAGQGGA